MKDLKWARVRGRDSERGKRERDHWTRNGAAGKQDIHWNGRQTRNKLEGPVNKKINCRDRQTRNKMAPSGSKK